MVEGILKDLSTNWETTIGVGTMTIRVNKEDRVSCAPINLHSRLGNADNKETKI
jgi:hypothetical protein